MTKNTGIPYEQFTRQIFDQIVNQNSVTTIDVKHNEILKGSSTRHQIDVYWQFEVGGIKYSTIVQAKDWTQPVNQGELLKFKAVLDDFPIRPEGIFVTKTGYQIGARQYAEKHGILLYELREASEDDLKNRVKTLVINLGVYFPHAENHKPIVDNAWYAKERERLHIPPDDTFTIQIAGEANEIIFTDRNGVRLIDAHQVINSLYPSPLQELAPIEKTYTFDDDTFILTNDDRFPMIKVTGLKTTISVSKTQEEIRIGGENIVAFILRNIVDNSERLFDKDINIIK